MRYFGSDTGLNLLGLVYQAPRVTIDVAFLELKNTGAAMKESIGTFRTIIQGPGSSSAVAA